MTKETVEKAMKLFAISEAQIQKIWTIIAKIPTENGYPIIKIFESLPLINSSEEAKKKSESEAKADDEVKENEVKLKRKNK